MLAPLELFKNGPALGWVHLLFFPPVWFFRLGGWPAETVSELCLRARLSALKVVWGY